MALKLKDLVIIIKTFITFRYKTCSKHSMNKEVNSNNYRKIKFRPEEFTDQNQPVLSVSVTGLAHSPLRFYKSGNEKITRSEIRHVSYRLHLKNQVMRT